MHTIRNYLPGDFDALLRLMNELDPQGQQTSREELTSALAFKRAAPERNIFVICQADDPVGYAQITRNRDLTVNRHFYTTRLPKDLYSDAPLLDRIIETVESRLVEVSKEYNEPLQIRSNCYDDEHRVVSALERHNYRLVRHYARMDRRSLTGLSEPTVLVPGVRIRLTDLSRDREQYIEVYNLVGEGSYEPHPITAQDYDEFLDEPYCQPGLLFVAERGDAIVGYCDSHITPVPEKDGLKWGVIAELGVVPTERGKGLGRALLRQGMMALRDAGAEALCLWVDYANTFGAKKLYYSEGFEDRYILRRYAKDGSPTESAIQTV